MACLFRFSGPWPWCRSAGVAAPRHRRLGRGGLLRGASARGGASDRWLDGGVTAAWAGDEAGYELGAGLGERARRGGGRRPHELTGNVLPGLEPCAVPCGVPDARAGVDERVLDAAAGAAVGADRSDVARVGRYRRTGVAMPHPAGVDPGDRKSVV